MKIGDRFVFTKIYLSRKSLDHCYVITGTKNCIDPICIKRGYCTKVMFEITFKDIIWVVCPHFTDDIILLGEAK